jgi:hypothetical protein
LDQSQPCCLVHGHGGYFSQRHANRAK